MTMKILRHHKGFSLIAVVIALGIVSVLGVGLFIFMATNQASRTEQLYIAQDYYNARAALEWSLRQVKDFGNPDPIPARNFMGYAFIITRSSGKIHVTTTQGNALNSYSIYDPGKGKACIYVLNGSASSAANYTGSGPINTTNCGMNVNSSSATAFTDSGSGNIFMQYINIVGSYSITGSGTVTTSVNGGTITTNSSAVSDPLLSYNVPSYSSCTYNNYSYSGSSATTMNPGVYCGGIAISGSGNMTINPGIYIVDGGSLAMSSSGQINGSGVTFILSGQISGNYPTVNISASHPITLSAPTSGTWSGILIFQDRNAPSSGTDSLSGSGSLNLTGAVYFPNQTLRYSGSGPINTPCTMIVVNQLNLTGSGYISCPAGSNFPY